jgi:hypothetical protein
MSSPDNSLIQSSLPTPHQTEAALSALAVRLVAANSEQRLTRDAVDGLVTILSANSAMIVLQPPRPLLYAAYKEFSDDIAALEAGFHEDPERICARLETSVGSGITTLGNTLLFPLLRNRRNIGFLILDPGRRPLHDGHMSEIATFCRALATSIGNSHQPKQVSGLEIAIHAPSNHNQDLYNFMALDRGCLGLFVAHVTARGPAASEFLKTMEATVHFLAREYGCPSDVVASVDSILHERHRASHQRLFSQFYGIYDPASRLLRFAGSDELEPIILAPTGTPRSPHGTEASGSARPRHRVMQLSAGDLLLCTTHETALQANRRVPASSLGELARNAAMAVTDDVSLSIKRIVAAFDAAQILPPTNLTFLAARVL